MSEYGSLYLTRRWIYHNLNSGSSNLSKPCSAFEWRIVAAIAEWHSTCHSDHTMKSTLLHLRTMSTLCVLRPPCIRFRTTFIWKIGAKLMEEIPEISTHYKVHVRLTTKAVLPRNSSNALPEIQELSVHWGTFGLLRMYLLTK